MKSNYLTHILHEFRLYIVCNTKTYMRRYIHHLAKIMLPTQAENIKISLSEHQSFINLGDRYAKCAIHRNTPQHSATPSWQNTIRVIMEYRRQWGATSEVDCTVNVMMITVACVYNSIPNTITMMG